MEIGKWKETMLSGGSSEEWGYICPECGCTVSDRCRLGFHYSQENKRLNYCPSCGTRLYGEPKKELPIIVASKFLTRYDKIFCTVRMKWHGEDIGVTVCCDIAYLEMQDYFHMEESE